MKILCVFGQHNYGNPARGQSYEYSNFLPALRQLGHEVEFFESFGRAGHTDFAQLNRALLETVDRLQPDLVFCVLMGYEIWRETLAIIRDAGIRLLHWGTDDSWKYGQFSRFLAPAFDRWVTTSHDAWQRAEREGHGNFILSQWAADATNLAEPLPAKDCRYPVSFIGSAYGNRRQWVDRLKRQGVEVACFGHGWPGGAITADAIPQIIRESVVSLNFGDSGLQFRGLRPYRSRQIKARVFEVPGAGGCLLTQSADYLEDYYRPDQEIAVFHDQTDLIATLQNLLANGAQRDAIAWAGYQRTRANHTYAARFGQILAQLPAIQPRRPIDFASFDLVAQRHRIGRLAHLLRALYVAPFCFLWGKRRGRRAARRLFFECYWRLAGQHSYSVAGWPGRLFYQES